MDRARGAELIRSGWIVDNPDSLDLIHLAAVLLVRVGRPAAGLYLLSTGQ